MYINSYNSGLPDLVNNSLDQIQAIENIKNSLKRSAEEFEAEQLLKKTKLASSTHVNNLNYLTDILTNDISYIEEGKNSINNTNEVSEIIEKNIELLYAQKSLMKDDKFQKIIEEFFPDDLVNKEIGIESEMCDPVVLSSNIDQETHLRSPPSTDILSLAWSTAVLSPDDNVEFQAKLGNIFSRLTNDVSSPSVQEIDHKIPKPMKQTWKDPEYRKMKTEAVKRSWEVLENRKKKKSELMKQKWDDPQYRKNKSEAIKRKLEDPECRKKMSQAMKQKWQNPEYREMRAEAIKRTCENPEYRKKMSEAMKKALQNPECKKKKSEAMKRNWENPEYRKKMSKAIQGFWKDEKKMRGEGSNNIQRTNQKKSEAMKRNWENPEYRKKMSEARKQRSEKMENKKGLEAFTTNGDIGT